jgi:hypothetical protein
MTPATERRLRELRSRLLIRAWDYKQRRHARGVWFRLRRLLAEASEAYALPLDEGRRLAAEGYAAEAVGLELAQPKLLLFAPAGRIGRISSACALELRLSADLLAAECVALVRFDDTTSATGEAPTTEET